MNPQPTGTCPDRAYFPQGLLLQWHITERCNLRCAHCYQDSYSGDELPFDQLLQILEQYKGLLARWRDTHGQALRGQITVTGGEPFVRNDFLDLLHVFARDRRQFRFAILSNGTLIDAALAKRLGELRPAFVQISVEGTRETHDRIRGAGNYDKAVAALRHLVRVRVRTLISFSAHRGNFREFPEVACLGRSLGVSRVWADRVIPSGSGAALASQLLTPEETCEFFQIMQSERERTNRQWFERTEIAMHRALQFLVGGGQAYCCTAGDSLITVQPNGDLYPCRRMPICVGNLMETPLGQLYDSSGLFRRLRDRALISAGCEDCCHRRSCRGGLKCLSYAVTGDPFTADPGCWHRSNTTGQSADEQSDAEKK